MKRWESFEFMLLSNNIKPGVTFMNSWVAQQLGVSTTEATEHMQAYQTAQRAVKSKTLFVLKRMPGTRTANAEWAIGQRTKDIKVLTKTFSNDFKHRFNEAIAPDLARIAEINPAAAKQTKKMINAIVSSIIPLVELTLE